MADAATLNALKGVLAQTLDANRQVRKTAEEQLRSMQSKPGFSLVLLNILESPTSADPRESLVKQASAVFFKNFLKNNWTREAGDQKENEIPINDKEQIKKHIVSLMCNVDPRLQRQLTEVVRIIGDHDFPERWQNLLPDLVGRILSGDLKVVNGLLETANTLFKMFRDKQASDELWTKLKYVLEQFQEPLLKLYVKISELVDQNKGNKQMLVELFTSLRLMTRIFYSLNWQEIPEYFEDHIKEWMGQFHKYLTYENPLLVDASEEETAGPIETLQSAIISNLKLYADKYDEEFQPFLGEFTQDSWNLLLKTGALVKYDDLVTNALKFLSTLVGKSMHKGLFSGNGVLQSICEKIVIPNLMFRPWDAENFEDNPLDYIRGDIEGSDKDSRRKTACDLVQSMCRQFEAEVTQMCLGFMQHMLGQYQQDPANNWPSKDAAITLMIALAIRRYTFQGGVSEVNDKVSVVDFFNQFILPELSSTAIDAHPVMKADALKFLTTFRKQIPKATIVNVLPSVVNLLKAKSFVVHTYAATAIDRIFVIRDEVAGHPQRQMVFRYGITELKPFLNQAFTNLFEILSNASQTENEYVMKAVMRVIVTTKEELVSVTGVVLEKLTALLGRVCTNPHNPVFNHFLFESIAAVVKFVCAANAGAVADFEKLLFPPFQSVLAQEVTELTPYVFQVMSLLLELSPPPPSPAYLSLFPALVQPALWENRGNAPVLVRLIEACLRKGADACVGSEPSRLEALLGVFQKLVASGSTEEYAFQLLVAIVEFLPTDKYANHLNLVFQIIFTRLQSTKSANFAKSLVFFLSVLSGKHGPTPAVKAIEALGGGLFWQVMNQVWFTTVPKIGRVMEKKACAIAMTRMLVEIPQMWNEQRAVGMKLVAAVVTLYERPTVENATLSPEELLANLAETGYSSSYSKLAYAQTEVRDSFKNINDGREYFVKMLHTYSQTHPGVVTPFVEEALKTHDDDAKVLQQAFQRYLQSANIASFQ